MTNVNQDAARLYILLPLMSIMLGCGGEAGETRDVREVAGQVLEGGTSVLSPFSRAKAEALLCDKLPCLGCRQLGGEGGHGTNGGGDGPNARYLPVRPTVHSDSAHMSERHDAALYDAIYAGGAIMGKSNRMPPFGFTLSSEEIGALVRHLRELCRCEGPAWSRD